MKAKVTIYLDLDLARALRLASADAGVTQGDIAGAALRVALASKGTPSSVARQTLEAGPGAALAVARRLREKGRELAAIAHNLNRTGYRTAQGRPYSAVSVCRLLRR